MEVFPATLGSRERLVGHGVGIVRPVGSRRIPLRDVRAVVFPATAPQGTTIGIARVDGIYGSFGSHWSRSWGRYRVHVTDHSKQVEIRLVDDSRVIVSPHDPPAFLRSLRRAAAEAGARVAIDGA
jgi:hypothetical protein